MNRYPVEQTPPYPAVASHMPVLWTLLQSVPWRSLYEFGAGAYSTPLLAEIAKLSGFATLTTGENDSKWLPSPLHPSHRTGSIPSTLLLITDHQENWGSEVVAFVDCEAELRAPLVHQIWDTTSAEYVVVHDTEPMQNRAYKMADEISLWETAIHVTCPFHFIRTTILSSRDVIPTGTRRTLESLDRNIQAHANAWQEIKQFLSW